MHGEIEKDMWYVTSKGTSKSLAYCWQGGDKWLVVSWGGSFRAVRLRMASTLRSTLVNTGIRREKYVSRKELFDQLMAWRQENVNSAVEETEEGQGPREVNLAYLSSRLEPTLYLHVRGDGSYLWVAEPRFAHDFRSEEEALKLLGEKIGVVEECSGMSINWCLVRIAV